MSAVVLIAFFRAPMTLDQLPAFALAHALISAFISGVTALLMLSHARSTGRRGYLMIGGTFLYLCGVLLFFPLYFPGAIVAGERIWGGPYSALNLYYAWHFAFPIGVSISALLIYFDQRSHRRPGLSSKQMWMGVGLSLLGVVVTLLVVSRIPGVAPNLANADGDKNLGAQHRRCGACGAVSGLRGDHGVLRAQRFADRPVAGRAGVVDPR